MNGTDEKNALTISDIILAAQALKGVAVKTPLQRDEVLSARYNADIYLKREDLQTVRSFKLRGAYNKIVSEPPQKLERGVVCASAGNHAQGVAYSCRALSVTGKIFMPVTTPKQKIEQVRRHGGETVEIILTGDTFDDSFAAAKLFADSRDMEFIHPFDDPRIIAGQGTCAMEIMNDISCELDYCFCTIGGGGLAAGTGLYLKEVSPRTRVIGVEPAGAACMQAAFKNGGPVTLPRVDTFVDGAAVKRAGDLTYALCAANLDDIAVIPEGKVCTFMLDLYNKNAIVTEPAGALSVAALDFYAEDIRGKNVVCVISGGNNDIERMTEIRERSLLFEGLKHFFVVSFPQRPGALKEFVLEALGPGDDITHFEYMKRTSKDKGAVLMGIELRDKGDHAALLEGMRRLGFDFREINDDPLLFSLLI